MGDNSPSFCCERHQLRIEGVKPVSESQSKVIGRDPPLPLPGRSHRFTLFTVQVSSTHWTAMLLPDGQRCLAFLVSGDFLFFVRFFFLSYKGETRTMRDLPLPDRRWSGLDWPGSEKRHFPGT